LSYIAINWAITYIKPVDTKISKLTARPLLAPKSVMRECDNNMQRKNLHELLISWQSLSALWRVSYWELF